MAAKILVLEDDRAILEALEMALQDGGYQTVTSTQNGERIEQLLREGLPDLILLDILLSGHDGRDICKRLKAQETTRYIPVVMISAHPAAKDAALEAGADGFLAKPFDLDELMAMVEQFV